MAKHGSDNGHKIFVSYARENSDWVEALELHKQPGGSERATIWIDRNRIYPGDEWSDEAKEALESATAVVLLISRKFLDSEAIKDNELPIIRRRYRKGEIVLVLVPIGQLETSEVGRALDVNNIDKLVSIPGWKEPLQSASSRRRDIRDQIISAATEPPEVQNLRRSLHSKYHLKQKLGSGPLGTVFIAYDSQLQREVTVKLLRARKRDRHFKNSVRNVGNVTDHTNILTVYGANLDAEPPHYVRQYASGDSLRYLLDVRYEGKPLPIPLVQELLQAIGEAINYAHKEKTYGINIKPSNIVVTDWCSPATRKYFLSLNSYREEELLNDKQWRDEKKDVLFVPLEYRNESIVRSTQDPQKADQYRLGLVAYEMLIGSERFDELAKPLRQLHFEPHTWQWPVVITERPDSPDYIGDAVDRMIRTMPEERYENIDDAITDVRTDIDVEVVRDSYGRLLTSQDSQTDFFRNFYMKFLKDNPGAKTYFRPRKKFGDLMDGGQVSKGWERQFQVLKEAVLLLVVFDVFNEDRNEPNILTRIVEEHAKRKIPAGLYQEFGDVLIDVVVEKDRDAPLSKSQLRRAWSNVIQPGIDYMVRRTGEIQVEHYRKP